MEVYNNITVEYEYVKNVKFILKKGGFIWKLDATEQCACASRVCLYYSDDRDTLPSVFVGYVLILSLNCPISPFDIFG